MCGRAVFPSASAICTRFGVETEVPSEVNRRMFYAEPGDQLVPVLLPIPRDGGVGHELVLTAMTWGFGQNNERYNARYETVETKPTWSSSFKTHRCVVPMMGFAEGGGVACNSDLDVLAACAIYKETPEGEPDRVAMLTMTSDGSAVKPFHPRRPMFIRPSASIEWMTLTRNPWKWGWQHEIGDEILKVGPVK